MRKAPLVIGLTVVGFIAVWRYEPGTQHSTGTGAPTGIGTAPPSSTPPSGNQPTSGSPSSDQPSSGTPGGPSGGTRTVAGSAVDMPYGTVQVQATFSGQRIVDVTVLQAPTDGRSGRIADNATPVLREEALQAQSAHLDTVSGATYTSEAYAQSLQAAIDGAGR